MAQNAKLPQRATVVDQPGCRANSPDGWSCTAVATHVAAGLDHVAYGAEGEICSTWPVTAPLDSESWDCRSCGAPHIGKRPADDTCAQCVVTQVTTEPPAQCQHCGMPVVRCVAVVDGVGSGCKGWRGQRCGGWTHFDLFHGCEDGRHQAEVTRNG